jgi:hypothetical protein
MSTRHYFTRSILLIFCIISWNVVSAQCTTGALYVTGAAPSCVGTPQTIASCQYAGEYSTVSLTAGVTYTFTSSIATDYITVATNPGNVAQVSGTQPVIFTPAVSGTYRIYTHLNAGCGTTASCRNLMVQCGTPPPPPNDNPCSAIALPVQVTCSYATYTNASATATAGIPAPGCGGYSGGDVWFSVTVPASGQLNFDTQTGVMLDGGMAVYSGTCASMTLIACDNDNSPNGAMPMLSLSGLTPGATLWIRVWENGNNNNGTFGICVVNPNPPPNPGDCPNAINVCSNTSFNITPSGSGNIVEFGTGSISNPSTNPNCCNSGCLLTGEVNSTWLLITIQTSGMLQFALGSAGGSGCYDWTMFGPYTASTCTSIASNSLAPIACNWNGSCNQFTGMANPLPAGGAASSFEQPIAVTAGQKYMICFSNYSSLTTTVPVNFMGSATIGCTPLPIELGNFYCSQKGNRMSVEWTTTSEINNNYFVIEKSLDGINFTELGTVLGAGNSNITNKYSLMDDAPQQGNNYYRLKQFDFNGENRTFETSSCEFQYDHHSSTVNIYSMTGQFIQTIQSVDYKYDVNALVLPTGMYVIQIITGDDVIHQTHFHGTGGGHWYGN